MIDYITNNYELIIGLVGALIGVAVIVAKMTPNTTDDTVVGKIKDVFDKLTKKS
jgi:Flp pilus assembly pilin Flp